MAGIINWQLQLKIDLMGRIVVLASIAFLFEFSTLSLKISQRNFSIFEGLRSVNFQLENKSRSRTCIIRRVARCL
jgi:hypothetical protein